jgi:hypothetical protein
LNFDPTKKEPVQIILSNTTGQSLSVTLEEESPYSEIFAGKVKIENGRIESGGKILEVKLGEEIMTQYGYGFMKKTAVLNIE